MPSDPEKAPANVEYILGDVRELLKSSDARLARGRADFVFSRLLIAGMADWRGYVRDMASLLRPGVGWLEIQDLALDWYLDGSLVSDSWEWLRALFCAAENKGWDLRCGRNAKGYMEEAGLVDVEVKEYRLPMGDWLVKTQPETRKIGENAAREYGMLYWHAIPRILKGMGYHEERIQEFRRQSVNDLRGREGLELRFYVTFGRKA